MKNYLLSLVVLVAANEIFAQSEGSEERPSTFTISISQENAFGFYPAIFGSFGLSEKSDFTYYSIFWTNPSFG